MKRGHTGSRKWPKLPLVAGRRAVRAAFLPPAGLAVVAGSTNLLIGLALTIAFALFARALRAVTVSGMVAGAILAFVLYAGGGLGTFAALVTVFLIAAGTTRLGYWRKQRLGIAEQRGGRRASQVIANLAVAAGMCLLALLAEHREGWLIASVAALAEAAADTGSSEVGQAVSGRAYLITDFSPVAVGTDGGISLPGTLAGVAGALLVATVAAATRVITLQWLLPSAGIGVLGMFADSVLGALAERRDLLDNDTVNLFSTAISALVALFLFWALHGQYWLT